MSSSCDAGHNETARSDAWLITERGMCEIRYRGEKKKTAEGSGLVQHVLPDKVQIAETTEDSVLIVNRQAKDDVITTE